MLVLKTDFRVWGSKAYKCWILICSLCWLFIIYFWCRNKITETLLRKKPTSNLQSECQSTCHHLKIPTPILLNNKPKIPTIRGINLKAITPIKTPPSTRWWTHLLSWCWTINEPWFHSKFIPKHRIIDYSRPISMRCPCCSLQVTTIVNN